MRTNIMRLTNILFYMIVRLYCQTRFEANINFVSMITNYWSTMYISAHGEITATINNCRLLVHEYDYYMN